MRPPMNSSSFSTPQSSVRGRGGKENGQAPGRIGLVYADRERTSESSPFDIDSLNQGSQVRGKFWMVQVDTCNSDFVKGDIREVIRMSSDGKNVVMAAYGSVNSVKVPLEAFVVPDVVTIPSPEETLQLAASSRSPSTTLSVL